MDLRPCSKKGRSSFSRSATTAQLSLQLRIFPPCTLNILIRRVRESHKVPLMRLNFISYCRLLPPREIAKSFSANGKMKHVPALYLATAMALQGMTKQELEALKLRMEEKRG